MTIKQATMIAETSQDSTIASLTGQKNLLQDSVDNWNKWYIRLLWLASFIVAATLLVGVATVVVQRTTMNLSKRLVSVQNDLDKEKDRVALADSRDKELKIAEAKQSAANANERAEGIARDNIKLKGDLDRSVEEARANAARLERQNLETQNRLLEANKELEQEKRERLALEAEISPRVFEDQLAAISALQRFNGTIARFEYLNDFECRRTAEQINFVLQHANWRTFGSSTNDDALIPNEVTVSVGGKEVADLELARSKADRSEQAEFALKVFEAFKREQTFFPIAQELATQLNRSGIKASTFAADRRLPIGTILIRVGTKSNPLLAKSPQSPPLSGLAIVRGNRAVIRDNIQP